MTGTQAIKEYAALCLRADRAPEASEFIGLTMFGIIPDWVEAL